MSKLRQLLAYLHRPDTTELVLGTGRPIAAKVNGGYQPITNTALSHEQLRELIAGSSLAALVPERDSNGAPMVVTLENRPYRVHAARRADAVLMKIEYAAELDRSVAPQGQSASASAAPTRPSAAAIPARATGRADSPPQGTARVPVATPRAATNAPRADSRAEKGAAVPRAAEPAFAGVDAVKRAAAAAAAAAAPAAPGPSAGLTGAAAIAAAIEFELSSNEGELDLGQPTAVPERLPSAPAVAAPVAPRAAVAAPVAQGGTIMATPSVHVPVAAVPVAAPVVAAMATTVLLPSAAPAPLAPAPTHAPVAAAAPGKPVHDDFVLESAAAVTMSPVFVDVVTQARARGTSDMHIVSGRQIMLRVVGDLIAVGQPLEHAAVESLLLPMLTQAQRQALASRGYADFAVDVPGAGRLRANVSRGRDGLKGSFRFIMPQVASLDELGLPKELTKVTSYHQGLVVIAGPNGHGKTTTLAALVDLINSTKPHHILCVEDPVELVHPRKQSLVSQREVGKNTRSFASALKASLREDPDVIVIGELRDRETVEIALTAAETGHLVMATMSTPSAAKTIDRLIDMFPPEDQGQVRVSLAGALRFIVAQRLLPNVGGESLVPAVELLTCTFSVAALIRDNKLFQLGNVQRGKGMIRLDESLVDLARNNRISEDIALRYAEAKREVHMAINPQAVAAAAAQAQAAAQAAAAAQGKGIDNIKSKFGGLFGKKE